jgi:hypothetical protein
VLSTVLRMIEGGVTHVGVATDHVIESFRNQLRPGYKTGAGVERSLLAHFQPLEDALAAMGVPVWPMVESEADGGPRSRAPLQGPGDTQDQRPPVHHRGRTRVARSGGRLRGLGRTHR